MMWIRANQTGARLLGMRLLMLLCFVLGQTPLPAAAAGAALMLEGSHVVDIQGGGGQCRVTLHHPASRLSIDAWAASHHHGWISRLLVSGASGSGESHPDHCLGFPSNPGGTLTPALGSTPLTAPLLLFLPDSRPPVFADSSNVPPLPRWGVQPNPQPRHPACLSTIVLLV